MHVRCDRVNRRNFCVKFRYLACRQGTDRNNHPPLPVRTPALQQIQIGLAGLSYPICCSGRSPLPINALRMASIGGNGLPGIPVEAVRSLDCFLAALLNACSKGSCGASSMTPAAGRFSAGFVESGFMSVESVSICETVSSAADPERSLLMLNACSPVSTAHTICTEN